MTIVIKQLSHIGIRVANLERSLAFYRHFGFELVCEDPNDAVVILTDPNGLEINLIINAASDSPPRNELMDIDTKHTGYTHIALEVSSYEGVLGYCVANGIEVSGGPVDLGDGVALFVRDPDRNVIELRESGVRVGRTYTG
tara:strand:- start:120 stop:542 length:423 start_codon:yes stop_codon:yes gene_type:complete